MKVLEDLGIVSEQTGQKKNRSYVCATCRGRERREFACGFNIVNERREQAGARSEERRVGKECW